MLSISHALLILSTFTLISGCISSGTKQSLNEELTLSPSAPQFDLTPNDLEPQPILTESESVKCTLVTQYGGRILSCSGEIGAEGEEMIGETLPQQDLEALAGEWNITHGNLSNFPNLHFIGTAEFNPDGSYKLTTRPLEFDPSEGTIEYVGVYGLEDFNIVGSGKSTIYQRGQVFGQTATDKITATLAGSGSTVEGRIESSTSFHEGGVAGGDVVTFEFMMERLE
jgi:hypothetical protein